MTHHGAASIAPTPLLARRSSPALLDTNRRFSRNNKSRNSFNTNTRAQNFSIQIAPLLDKKRNPARAPLTRRSRIRTSQRQISNRNTTPFKNPANLIKTNPKPKSNRNKNTIPPYLMHRESRFTNRVFCVSDGFAGHAVPITNYAPLPDVTLLHPRSNRHTTPITVHHSTKINRKPTRLEILISLRKQTPAPSINRKLLRTSANAFPVPIADLLVPSDGDVLRVIALQPLRSKRRGRDTQPGQLASQLRASSWLENTSMVKFRFWATRTPNPSVVGSFRQRLPLDSSHVA